MDEMVAIIFVVWFSGLFTIRLLFRIRGEKKPLVKAIPVYQILYHCIFRGSAIDLIANFFFFLIVFSFATDINPIQASAFVTLFLVPFYRICFLLTFLAMYIADRVVIAKSL
jgi:hypothetical protein